jgi:homoserine kinase type II
MEEIFPLINNLYNISVISFEKVALGYLTDNYILFDNTKKYFLKKYRFKDEERIKGIQAAKQYFYEGGIPVILPITSNEGKGFFVFNGEYYALFPFIKGIHIAKENLSNNSIISLAQMLGKIHALGQKATFPIDTKFKGWSKEKMMAKLETMIDLLNKTDLTVDFNKSALEDLKLKKLLVESNNETIEDLGIKSDCLVHGDYHDFNVFFDDSGKVCYVFDFEKTMYAPRMYELMRSMINDFFFPHLQKIDIQKARLYLKSYLGICPATNEELRLGFKLYYLRSIHGIWVEEEHYLHGNTRVDRFLIEDYNKLKYITDNFAELQKQLFD